MSNIGVIGLGVMGAPIARNLLSPGHEVFVHNRSQAAVDALAEAGAHPRASAAELARDVDVVITVLPDSPDVERVALGTDGILSAAREGLLHIDMSTIRPETARHVASACAGRGVRFIDAPVSGGEQAAIDGTLSIMVGGAEEDFTMAREIFAALGATVVRVGPVGAGQTVKAANQLLVAGTIQLVSEAIVLLEACGVDMEGAVKVLAGGLAGSHVLERKADAMLARSFEPGFRVDLHHKDLQIALATGADAAVALPVTGLVAQFIQSLRAKGLGALDHGALLAVVEDLSGRSGARSAATR